MTIANWVLGVTRWSAFVSPDRREVPVKVHLNGSDLSLQSLMTPKGESEESGLWHRRVLEDVAMSVVRGPGRGPPMAKLRRAIPRQPAEWTGRYRFNDESADRAMRECRIVDISRLGTGVELLDTTLAEALDQLLVVTVDLRGRVRNAREVDGGVVRAGVEFSDEFVGNLRELGMRW